MVTSKNLVRRAEMKGRAQKTAMYLALMMGSTACSAPDRTIAQGNISAKGESEPLEERLRKLNESFEELNTSVDGFSSETAQYCRQLVQYLSAKRKETK